MRKKRFRLDAKKATVLWKKKGKKGLLDVLKNSFSFPIPILLPLLRALAVLRRQRMNIFAGMDVWSDGRSDGQNSDPQILPPLVRGDN